MKYKVKMGKKRVGKKKFSERLLMFKGANW